MQSEYRVPQAFSSGPPLNPAQPLTHLYGLSVATDLPVPGFPAPAPTAPDVSITLVAQHLDRLPQGRSSESQPLTAGGDSLVHDCRISRMDSPNAGKCLRLDYPEGVSIVLNEDLTRIWCAWVGDATLDDAATYLYGPIMAYAAYRRGFFCLHACAVAVDGRAIVLAGQSGTGKSTMAAAFAVRGFPILTEDVAALDATGEPPWVHPGYPLIGLWPPAVEAVFGPGFDLPAITPQAHDWDKRFLALSPGRHDGQDGQDGPAFCPEPLPLGAVYVLEPAEAGTALTFEPLHGAAAAMALIGGIYPQILYSHHTMARDLDDAAQLAQIAAVRRLKLPHGGGNLDDSCQAIVKDFRAGDRT